MNPRGRWKQGSQLSACPAFVRAQKLARRIYEQQVAAVNKNMMQEASLRRAMEQEQELEDGRRALSTQVSFAGLEISTHMQ